MTVDESIWDKWLKTNWSRGSMLAKEDLEILEETQKYREELDRIEQRVSKSANWSDSNKRLSKARVGH